MKVKNVIIAFIILFLFWLLLNDSIAQEVIISGIVASLVIALLVCSRCDVFSELKLTPKAFAYTFVYLFVFLWELIKSNIDVALRVISPSLPINPGIVEVKTRLKSKMGRMILADSITLTPGTFTLEIKGDTLFIHWIDVKAQDVEQATKEIIRKFEKYLEVIYG